MDHKKEQLPAISPLPEDREIVDEIRDQVSRLRQNTPDASRVVSGLEQETAELPQVMPVRSVSEVRPVASSGDDRPEAEPKREPQREIPANPRPQPEIPQTPAPVPSPEVAESEEASFFDDPKQKKKEKKEKRSRRKEKKAAKEIADEMENDIYYGVRIRSYDEIKRDLEQNGPKPSEPTSTFTYLFDDTAEMPKIMLSKDPEELKREREERARQAVEDALTELPLGDAPLDTTPIDEDKPLAPEFGHRQAAPPDDRPIIIDGFDYTEWKRNTQQIPILTDEVLAAHQDTDLPVTLSPETESDTLPVTLRRDAPLAPDIQALEALMEQALAQPEKPSVAEQENPAQPPVMEESKAEKPTVEELKMEAPAVVESKVEKPAVEEPETEEPAAEEPIVEKSAASPVELNIDQAEASLPPVTEEPEEIPAPEKAEPDLTPEPEPEVLPQPEPASQPEPAAEEPAVQKAEPPSAPPALPVHFVPVPDPQRYRFHPIPVRTFRLDNINDILRGELETYRDPDHTPAPPQEPPKPQKQESGSAYGKVISLSAGAGGIEAAIQEAIRQADENQLWEAQHQPEPEQTPSQPEQQRKQEEPTAERPFPEKETPAPLPVPEAVTSSEEPPKEEPSQQPEDFKEETTSPEETTEETPASQKAEPTLSEETEPDSPEAEPSENKEDDSPQTAPGQPAEETTSSVTEAEESAEKTPEETEPAASSEPSSAKEAAQPDTPEEAEAAPSEAEDAEKAEDPSASAAPAEENRELTSSSDGKTEVITGEANPAAKQTFRPVIPAMEIPDEPLEEAEEPHHSFFRKKPSSPCGEEYTRDSDPKQISKELQTATKELQIRTVVTGFCTAALLVLGLIYEKWIPDTATAFPYLIINLALLVAPAALCFKTIANGIKSLFGLQGNTDSGIAVAVLAAIIHNGALFFNSSLVLTGAVHLYSAIAVGALMLNSIGKLSMMNRIARNFIFVNSADTKCSVEFYDDMNTAIQLAKGCVSQAPKIAYQRKTKFLKNFLHHSYDGDPSMRTSQLIAPIALVASVALCIVTIIITGSVLLGLTALSVATCISAPLASLLCVNLPVANLCNLARRHGAMLSGYEAVEKMAATNAVLLDSTDLFPKDSVSLADVKIYHGKRTERAIFSAASVMSNIGGTLRDLFEGVITSQKEMLPKATDIAYVEGQGMTGMVGGKRLRIGNRLMMEQNNIQLPGDHRTLRLKDNQCVIFLAEDEELMAMLTVSYHPDGSTVHEIQRLESCGIAAIVRTLDPNLTAEFLSKLFSIDENAIKVLPAELGDCCDKALGDVSESCDALLATRGQSFSMMRMLSACVRQKHNISLSVTMQIVSVILGFVLVAFLSCYAGLQQLSTLAILLYEAFWLAAIILIPKLRKP